ncbi:MAG: hypothetical protein DMD91_29335, partial [Candidatus Rokuibacteriota bacterium]
QRSDIASFLERVEEKGILIYTNGGLHDPSSEDGASSLGLDIAGIFGAWDNRLRARRMRDAKLAKAKRGQAVSPPPIGYFRTPGGGWIKNPDRAVQDAILRVFDLYPRLGSLGKVVAYFREHGLEFPRRSRGQVRWGPVDAALLHSVLRNPAYCGDYVFLRRHSKKLRDATRVTVKFRSPDEWIVTHDHHEAYLPREAWQRIQDMLSSYRVTLRPLIGKGHAMLQGLLRHDAASCHRRMNTQYWGRAGVARLATYTCRRQNGWGDATHKVACPARFIDQAVVEHVFQALTAIDHDTAREVIEQSQLQHAALERAQHRQLLDAEEDVQKIRQLLLNLPPDVQAARIDLAAQYNTAVERQLELKTKLKMNTTPSLSVTSADIDDLVQLTRNVRQLWAAPQRTDDERKRLLRTLISEVILHHADREGADLEIVWKGGLRQPVRVLRPRGVEATVRDLTLQGKSAVRIADELNAAGVVSSSGRPMSKNLVGQKQRSQGLGLNEERRLARQIIRRELMNNTPRPQILRLLQEQAARLGPWDPQRLSEAIRAMRRRARGIEPLPRVLPGEEEKQRVLALTEQALAAGKAWKAIAVMLNNAGLRPPRGMAVTPVQVRLLYLRAHGLTSFKLPKRRDSNESGV